LRKRQGYNAKLSIGTKVSRVRGTAGIIIFRYREVTQVTCEMRVMMLARDAPGKPRTANNDTDEDNGSSAAGSRSQSDGRIVAAPTTLLRRVIHVKNSRTNPIDETTPGICRITRRRRMQRSRPLLPAPFSNSSSEARCKSVCFTGCESDETRTPPRTTLQRIPPPPPPRSSRVIHRV